jgi:hypothetical protein
MRLDSEVRTHKSSSNSTDGANLRAECSLMLPYRWILAVMADNHRNPHGLAAVWCLAPEWRTPERGPKERSRTLAALEPEPQYLPPPPDRPTRLPPSSTQRVSVADEIAKLATLHSSGALTDEEFTAHKARLLP